jgi:hypothetical protein
VDPPFLVEWVGDYGDIGDVVGGLCRLIEQAFGQNSQYLPPVGSRFVPIRSIRHALTKIEPESCKLGAPGLCLSIRGVPLSRSRPEPVRWQRAPACAGSLD